MDNKIKYYRDKRGLSQRKLAEAVGTSQQQIQRFETGMPVKLEMAGAIAEALGVTIPAVFPGSRKPLEKVVKQGKIETAFTDTEIEDSLLEAGIEADPCIWTARILLRGRELKLYRISVSDRKRLERYYLDQSERPDSDSVNFFRFDTEDREILINMDDVVMWQNCFHAPFRFNESKGEEFHGLNVYFTGRNEAMHFGVESDCDKPENPEEDEDEGQFRNMLAMMDGLSDRNEFVSFQDEDGEWAYLKVGDISILEIAKTITNPELLDSDEDEGIDTINQQPDATDTKLN